MVESKDLYKEVKEEDFRNLIIDSEYLLFQCNLLRVYRQVL